MAFIDENAPRRAPDEIRIGQDLSLWSVSELEQRIRTLEVEIERTRKDIASKSHHLTQAESLFGRK